MATFPNGKGWWRKFWREYVPGYSGHVGQIWWNSVKPFPRNAIWCKKSRWRTSCGPEVAGDVISGGVIEVNKRGPHTKFRDSSSTHSWDLCRVQICNIYKMADCSRPEVDSDIISGRIEDGVETNLCANFGDPASSGTFLFPPTRPSRALWQYPL